ncbi:MAG: amidohydrolase family protein [Acidobacteriota bacterium]
MPALVNAHTHLELSWLRGRVPPAASFIDWVTRLVVTRGGRHESADDPAVLDAARQAAREAREFGTIAVGDITNSLASVDAIRENGLAGIVFHELLGFNVTDGALVDATRTAREAAARRAGPDLRVSIAPHAPYSTSPELFAAIRREVNRSAVPITAVHLAESESEVAFLRSGDGPWPAILRRLGVARDGWTPPGVDPVEYLDDLGMLDARTLVIHGVQLEQPALARLAAIGCTLVTCPRSNQWVGVGVPPLSRFLAAGLRLAIGTDSLASVEDMNLFAELKTMRWLVPEAPARTLLACATLHGAAALGLEAELGSIEVGKRAALITVDLSPSGDADPEERLVNGVEEKEIRWVEP